MKEDIENKAQASYTEYCSNRQYVDTYEGYQFIDGFTLGFEMGRKEGILELFDKCEEFRHENENLKKIILEENLEINRLRLELKQQVEENASLKDKLVIGNNKIENKELLNK